MQKVALLFGLRPVDLRRLTLALALLVGILIVGTVGYTSLTSASLLDSFYMTIITVTTVGFGERVPMNQTAMLFTTGLIVASVVWGAWALQSALSTILSDEFRHAVQQLRSIRGIRLMEGHTILCGFGRIGRAAAAELARNNEPFVVIDVDLALVEGLREEAMHVIYGDATDDDVLLAANIRKAKRLLAVLDSDNANIVTVLSARELNPDLWIASRVVQAAAASKLLRAGANEVLSPYDYGGRRLALTALRPHVAQFLSMVVFDEGRGAEMDELRVVDGSKLAGRTLAEINLRQRFGVTVVALYHPDIAQHIDIGFDLNPGPETILHASDVLIVVGRREQLESVHRALQS
ncbi:MAG: potassium channel protein [Chloroflexi bacterium]|nr:potassium channel protein [Chloroflexota bacterium]